MATAKKLPSGSWSINVYIGKDENGKRKYKRFTGPDKRKVEREAAAYADEHRYAIDYNSFGVAANNYISSKSNVLSPTTICSYRQILRTHLEIWENKSVDDITNQMIQTLINEKSRSLSPKTVRNIYGFITAVVYSVNPMARFNVTLPAPVKHFKELPRPEDVFNAVKGTDIELPALLAMWLSLRMSEIRGLRYSDISGNIITIRNTMVNTDDGDILKECTKTYGSTRRLVVPEYIMSLINRSDHENKDEFVVPYTHGRIYKGFQKCLKAAGLEPMPFHDLRHLNASIMLRLGIPDKYAMERGGWSSTNVLKSVYQNTFSDERLAVDKKIDSYFLELIDPMQHNNAT